MKRLLITPRGFSKVGLEEIELLKKNGIDVHYNDTGKPYSSSEFKKLARDVDGMIVGVEDVNEEIMSLSPHLKVICKFGVGVDNIDLEYAHKKNIYIGRTVGSNSQSVAEHVIAFIFADSKNLLTSINSVKEGKWNKLTGSEVAGKNIGIIGFGDIGKRVASIAKAIGMNVITYDLFDIEEEILKDYGAIQVSLNNILGLSDYLTLHVPLTNETKNLITLNELKKMKKTACIINTSRGGVVNEKDLFVALREKIIKSAYFDVYSAEPPQKEDELLSLDNFYLTPHIAARTFEAEKRTCVMATKIILDNIF